MWNSLISTTFLSKQQTFYLVKSTFYDIVAIFASDFSSEQSMTIQFMVNYTANAWLKIILEFMGFLHYNIFYLKSFLIISGIF